MLLPTLGEHQGSPVWVQMERFHPTRFLSTAKARKGRNVNQPFTCWTPTGVLTGFVIFTCPEGSCSLSYAGVNLDRFQRYGNLSIYIRINGSSSAHWQKPPPLCSCAAHAAQHHNAQGPSVHTGGGGGGCCILEKQHIIYPTSKLSLCFYPRKTWPAPSTPFPAPVPAGGGLLEPCVWLSSTWQP